jgi:hypothetical protein
MTAIKPECADNAKRMLETSATYLGGFGACNFYLLDGKAWIIAGDCVLRCDDDSETEVTLRACRTMSRHRETLQVLQEIANDRRVDLVTSERRCHVYSILNNAGLL